MGLGNRWWVRAVWRGGGGGVRWSSCEGGIEVVQLLRERVLRTPCFEGGEDDFWNGYHDVWLVVVVDGCIIYWVVLSLGHHLHPPLMPDIKIKPYLYLTPSSNFILLASSASFIASVVMGRWDSWWDFGRSLEGGKKFLQRGGCGRRRIR